MVDPAIPGQYGGTQPPPPPYGGGGDQAARAKVAGPAIGLMVVAGIGICIQILGILWKLFMGAVAMSQMQNDVPAPLEGIRAFFNGPVGIILGFLGILVGVLILVGAMKMKSLQNYGLAMIVTILAMIPCISPCCILGLPIGIWALIVLLDPNVKAAFRG